MAVEVPMPRLSDTMEEGTIARWVKHEGDHVVAGDVIAEIDTDKATMELTSYEDGVLLKILVAEGESADLGAPIALIGSEEEVPETAPREQEPSREAAPGETPTEQPHGAEAGQGESALSELREPADSAQVSVEATGEVRASPIARRMASEAGVDLRALAGKGSGPDGRIVKVDLERAVGDVDRPGRTAAEPTVASSPPPSAEQEVIDATPMLRAVARRMSESKATVPHFYLNAEIDMGRTLEVREELNQALAGGDEKISINDLVVRAAALALVENPKFHRSWQDGRLTHHKSAHVGIAVALDDGLIVPVLRSVEGKSVREIGRESRDLVERARSGKLKQSEIEGGTFTVSNLGMFGIPSFSAVLNPPEPGILAVGAVVKRAVVSDDAVQIRPIMAVTLSVDHRATSGAEGARLLASIKRRLEQPLLLLT